MPAVNYQYLFMAIAVIAMPPVLILPSRNRLRGFLSSVAAVWLLVVVDSELHLAFTPDYDSMAPGLAMVAGWIPGIFYSAIWLGVAFFFDWLKRRRESNSDDA